MLELADDWAFRLKDLPEDFDDFSDGLKMVTRPIFNSLLVHAESVADAVKLTLHHLDLRGIRDGNELVQVEH